MKYCFLLLAIPLLLGAETVWRSDIQKPFTITMRLSSEKISLGDFIDLEADFHYPDSYQLQVDSLLEQLTWSANPLTPQLHLDRSSIASLHVEEGIEAKRLRTTITPLVEGSLDLSLLSVKFLPKEHSVSPQHILTPVFKLQVLPRHNQSASLPLAPLIPLEPQFPLGLTQANRQSLIENPQRLEDEKRNIQWTLEEHAFPWLWIMGLLGFGGICWTAYLTRDRWPKRQPKPKIALSIKEQAKKDLETLQKSHFLEKGFIQTYCTELASILLNNLQSLLGLKNKKLTTFELTNALKDESILSTNQKEEIHAILTECDQIKFAQKKPSPEMAQQMYQSVENLIEIVMKPRVKKNE